MSILAYPKFLRCCNLTTDSLHGTWDSINPIGSHVYAHTNMTEIKQAFDLFWRNSVPANKLNLGIGFYGRSFQLSDPSCYKPGCNFKGGASPGAVCYLPSVYKNSKNLYFLVHSQLGDSVIQGNYADHRSESPYPIL